jgi:hypothetical protein
LRGEFHTRRKVIEKRLIDGVPFLLPKGRMRFRPYGAGRDRNRAGMMSTGNHPPQISKI